MSAVRKTFFTRTVSAAASILAGVAVAAVAILPLAGCNRAYAAEGTQSIDAATLATQLETENAPLVVDVRTPEEYAGGHVPGALNIPFDQMEARASEIVMHKDQPVVLYCRSGRRAGIASETLAAKGFSQVKLLEGDMPGWEQSGHPVEARE